jgi:hypothetical protein
MSAIDKACRRDNKLERRPKKHKEYDKRSKDKRKTIQIEKQRKEKQERLEGEE